MNATGLPDLASVDDVEAWPSMQRTARGVVGAEQPLRYDARSGPTPPPGWNGPGLVYTGVSKDDNQWNWWRRWFELMTADEARSA